jgi:hypothetical protein
MQGAVRDTGTGYLDFGTVTGQRGRTRSGSTYDPEDLVRHVRLHPSGQFEIGYDTDPEARPATSLLVRGNVEVDGDLFVGGSRVGDPLPAPACSVRTANGSGRTATAVCLAGEVATGGGGTCATGDMRGSRPLVAADGPPAWELACSRTGAHTVYVICCVR